jgi:hypothetical protein
MTLDVYTSSSCPSLQSCTGQRESLGGIDDSPKATPGYESRMGLSLTIFTARSRWFLFSQLNIIVGIARFSRRPII